MVVFTLLKVDKDSIRATSYVFAVLELSARVLAFALLATVGGEASLAGAVEGAGSAGVFAGIVVASWAGYGLGAWLRGFVDSEAIIRMLLVIVYLSAASMLGAFQSAAVLAALAGVTAAVLLVVAALYRCPDAPGAACAAVRRATCARRTPPPPEGAARARPPGLAPPPRPPDGDGAATPPPRSSPHISHSPSQMSPQMTDWLRG